MGMKMKITGESKLNDSSEKKAHLQVSPLQNLALTNIFVIFFSQRSYYSFGMATKERYSRDVHHWSQVRNRELMVCHL